MTVYAAFDGMSTWITKTNSKYVSNVVTYDNCVFYPIYAYMFAINSKLEGSQNYELVKLANAFVSRMQKAGISDQTIKRILFDWIAEEGF